MTPAEIYDIDAIRVDRNALTIREAASVLNNELTAPVVAQLVRKAIGDQVDQFPIRSLKRVYERVLPKVFEPDEAVQSRVEGLRPNVTTITLGEYHEFLDASERKIAFPPVAATLLIKAYGEDILNEPYAAAALLLKKIFDVVGDEGNE